MRVQSPRPSGSAAGGPTPGVASHRMEQLLHTAATITISRQNLVKSLVWEGEGSVECGVGMGRGEGGVG